MKLLNKKAQAGVLGGLQQAILAIATIAMILAIVLLVLTEFASTANTSDYCKGYYNATSSRCQINTTTQTALDPTAYTATNSIITKLSTAPTWIGIIVIMVFATAVMAYFYFRG